MNVRGQTQDPFIFSLGKHHGNPPSRGLDGPVSQSVQFEKEKKKSLVYDESRTVISVLFICHPSH